MPGPADDGGIGLRAKIPGDVSTFPLTRLRRFRRTAALEIPFWLLYAVPMAGLVSGAVRAVINIFTAHRREPVFDPTGES